MINVFMSLVNLKIIFVKKERILVLKQLKVISCKKNYPLNIKYKIGLAK